MKRFESYKMTLVASISSRPFGNSRTCLKSSGVIQLWHCFSEPHGCPKRDSFYNAPCDRLSDVLRSARLEDGHIALETNHVVDAVLTVVFECAGNMRLFLSFSPVWISAFFFHGSKTPILCCSWQNLATYFSWYTSPQSPRDFTFCAGLEPAGRNRSITAVGG